MAGLLCFATAKVYPLCQRHSAHLWERREWNSLFSVPPIAKHALTINEDRCQSCVTLPSRSAMQTFYSREGGGRSSLTLCCHTIFFAPAFPCESDHFKGSLRKDSIWKTHDCHKGCWLIVRDQVEIASVSGFNRNQTFHELHMRPRSQPLSLDHSRLWCCVC